MSERVDKSSNMPGGGKRRAPVRILAGASRPTLLFFGQVSAMIVHIRHDGHGTVGDARNMMVVIR